MPGGFPHRGDEVAVQAASGAVRYDISYDPARDRWYMDASWRTDPGEPPAIDWLREMPVLAVDLNYDHLAAWVVLPDGNPAGAPVTVPLMMTGLVSLASRRATAGRDQHREPDGEAPRLPGRGDRRPGLRRRARKAGRIKAVGPHAASAAGPSVGSQAASRPPGSGTGSRRWPITRA